MAVLCSLASSQGSVSTVFPGIVAGKMEPTSPTGHDDGSQIYCDDWQWQDYGSQWQDDGSQWQDYGYGDVATDLAPSQVDIEQTPAASSSGPDIGSAAQRRRDRVGLGWRIS